jgi:hypothetical protein
MSWGFIGRLPGKKTIRFLEREMRLNMVQSNGNGEWETIVSICHLPLSMPIYPYSRFLVTLTLKMEVACFSET